MNHLREVKNCGANLKDLDNMGASVKNIDFIGKVISDVWGECLFLIPVHTPNQIN